jgi:hypothetical protein
MFSICDKLDMASTQRKGIIQHSPQGKENYPKIAINKRELQKHQFQINAHGRHHALKCSLPAPGHWTTSLDIYLELLNQKQKLEQRDDIKSTQNL